MKLLPREGKSLIPAPLSAGPLVNHARRMISWQALGAALLGVMLAHWTWLLLAPAGAAMAPATWQASADSGRVFGTAPAAGGAATAAAPANIKLIGVFANRTKGFAVMEVNNKQVGVAQGDDVSPGVRLEETHADYVVLNQGGVRQRVTLSDAPAVPTAAAPAAPPVMGRPLVSRPAARMPPPNTLAQRLQSPGADQAVRQRMDVLRRQMAANPNMPPAQREFLRHQIEGLQHQIDSTTRGIR